MTRQTLIFGCIAALLVVIAAWAAVFGAPDVTTYGWMGVYWGMAGAMLVILGILYFAFVRLILPKVPQQDGLNNFILTNSVVNDRNYWIWRLAGWPIIFAILILPGNIFIMLNYWLDQSAAYEASYVIHRKTAVTAGRGAGTKYAYFRMRQSGSTDPGDEENVVVADQPTYDRIIPRRSKVVMTLHRGAFGCPWRAERPLLSDLAPRS